MVWLSCENHIWLRKTAVISIVIHFPRRFLAYEIGEHLLLHLIRNIQIQTHQMWSFHWSYVNEKLLSEKLKTKAVRQMQWSEKYIYLWVKTRSVKMHKKRKYWSKVQILQICTSEQHLGKSSLSWVTFTASTHTAHRWPVKIFEDLLFSSLRFLKSENQLRSRTAKKWCERLWMWFDRWFQMRSLQRVTQ